MTADMGGKNRMLDQTAARHHHQITPTDPLLYARASASMAGAKDRVRDTTSFKTRPMDFFPWLAAHPSLAPAHRRTESSAVVMHCHVTTRFDVSSCPVKGGHWLTSSSAPSQVQTPTENIPCLRAPASMAGTKHCLRDTTSSSTRPMDFFPWLAAYPSLAPKL
jgi:hypothetical protein